MILEWKVANETNLSQYTVSRSKDGINFLPIGTVRATGANTVYTLMDGLPLKGNNYYQLIMVDKNGEIKRSNIVFVDFNNNVNFKILSNPFNNNIDVLVENNSAAVTATLIDLAGKTVFSKNYTTTAGNIFSLDVKNIPGGVYHLKLYDGQNTGVFKVIKQ